MAYELTGTDISVDPMHDRLRSLKGPCEWCHGNRRPVGRLRCQRDLGEGWGHGGNPTEPRIQAEIRASED
jgi:hypothetical protein